MSRDDERRKLSWREIDKLRDQSGFSKLRRKREKAENSRIKENFRIKERYLKELEKLFTKKDDQEKHQLIEKLHKSYGTKNFKKLAKQYIERYGLPEDWRTLLLFLDLEERKIILDIINKLKEDFPNRNISEKQSIISKLKTVALTSKDEIIGFKVEEALKEFVI
ncbi:MAG: hypothetical protein DRP29_03050 [Thermodesulfobacteriota bacterium]|nr:MAG: hypothetical protein DRP29_03050 [Thermodesulfobacteriota bacterium]